MKTIAGLWIDHRKAIIVTVSDRGEETRLIISKVEKQPARVGGIRSTQPYKSRTVPADDSQQRTFTGHLNVYYDAVIAGIRNAESILIFGPGEAKGELKKRLQRSRLDGRVAGVETKDKMTDRQIAAEVHGYFTKIKEHTL
jgi:hypothetical protein